MAMLALVENAVNETSKLFSSSLLEVRNFWEVVQMF
jgi:hypothetical protein